MPNALCDDLRKDIAAIAVKYGLEVVGYLKLDEEARGMSPLKGVKWADPEVDVSKIKDPMELMPSAKSMVILGKRLMDDKFGQDMHFRLSGEYNASVEMMALDLAALKTIEALEKDGHHGVEYPSYGMKAWAALAGLGWIGKSGMFVSSDHGPRLRLKSIVTDANIGEPVNVLGSDRCEGCEECVKACPVGAISENAVDHKKCDACPVNHRKVFSYTTLVCTACTTACPVGAHGRKPGRAPQADRGNR